MKVILGGKYNLYSTTLDISAKTLTISNVVGFDITQQSLKSIYSSTASVYLPVDANIASCTMAYVAGLPVWTVTFTAITAGIANSDTLVILLDIPDTQAVYSILSYSASKV